jgi:signal transduction histidine kinase/ligand-binding sensor domain-containing protein/DNA-binding response OmpR family regulator
MLQDSRGFMWFGTRDGLNKYDGYTFTVFKNDVKDKASLSGSIIMDMKEDVKGSLWIATWGGGISKFDRDTEKFIQFKHNSNDPNSLSSDHVNSIFIDHSGLLWIGTEGGGLDSFDEQKGVFKNYKHQKGNPSSLSQDVVKDVFEDSEHNLWIATFGGGLNLFDRMNKSFTHFKHGEDEKKSISSDNVTVVFEDNEQQLWIGTRGGGLNLFDRASKQFIRFTKGIQDGRTNVNDVIVSLGDDDRGNLWVGTENGGLNIYDKSSSTFNNYQHDDVDPGSLSNNSVWAIYNDQIGNMWVGTFSGDLNYWSADGNKFVHYRRNSSKHSLSHNKVLSIYEDSRSRLWIGTDGGGANLYDSKTGNFIHYEHKENDPNSICGNHVLSILEDSKGNIWFGTWADGISVFNQKHNSYTHFRNNPRDPKSLSSNNVWTIFEDSNKNIWIGTYFGGLNLYDPHTQSFTHFGDSEGTEGGINNKINSIFEDRSGRLLIGTDGGGFSIFDVQSKTFTHFRHDEHENSISSNNVGNILQDKAGNFWIGTMSGLNYMDAESKTFATYRTNDGLSNDAVFGILEDSSGNLWISTNRGISKFDPDTKHFINFDVTDGLQSNEFKMNAFRKTRQGVMYFGGNNGFNEFYPDSIKGIPYDPPIVLTDFRIFNKPVSIAGELNQKSPLRKSIGETDEITLPYGQSAIAFEFASLNYTHRDNKKYQYFLEGFDEEWNDIATKHAAAYTNLYPGKYLFKVRGLDNLGQWSNNIRTLSLTIDPPYWMRWWFILPVFLAIAGSLVAVFRMWIGVVKTRERASRLIYATNIERIARRDADKARHEAEQANLAKSIFLATMSHEIRTPMNGVIGMASLLSETPLTEEQREYTETIKSSGESLLAVINDILDFSKIESGKMTLEDKAFDLRDCIEEVLDMFAGRAAKAGLDLVYQMDSIVPAVIVGDSLRLRQVLTNLVGNAIKFTRNGEVFVGVRLINSDGDMRRIGFEIRDSGIGIPKEKIGQLFKAFSQVDSSTTRKYGGTGLGLVISEKLVELMGGTIEAKSAEGYGTTFSFSINTRIAENSHQNRIPRNIRHIAGKKALIIDDNATSRNSLRSQLEQWKMITSLACSGKQALDILASDTDFSILLVDIHMPEMDGLQLGIAIRKLNPSLPIILLGAIGDERWKNHPDVFSSSLTKPLKQDLLFQHINRVLGTSNQSLSNEHHVEQVLSVEFAKKYPLQILVADDNPVNQMLTARVLHKLGYVAEIVSNGLHALNSAREKQFDLILMDVQMPEMDGLEATRQIRMQLTHQPVIIAMTANAIQGDREQCLDAGMDDYISKPVVLQVLVNALEKWALTII